MKELDALGTYAERQAVTDAAMHQNAPYNLPDAKGHFGQYGGSFVSETLSHALAELKEAYAHYSKDPSFLAEFHYDLKHFVGRPSPIYHAKRWSEKMGGAQIYFKREDLNHTGAHKINNVIGQALLAQSHGQAAYHRGNRRRSAWRGDGNDLRTFRSRMRGLHGQRRRQAPGAERLSHEAARRDRGAG